MCLEYLPSFIPGLSGVSFLVRPRVRPRGIDLCPQLRPKVVPMKIVPAEPRYRARVCIMRGRLASWKPHCHVRPAPSGPRHLEPLGASNMGPTLRVAFNNENNYPNQKVLGCNHLGMAVRWVGFDAWLPISVEVNNPEPTFDPQSCCITFGTHVEELQSHAAFGSLGPGFIGTDLSNTYFGSPGCCEGYSCLRRCRLHQTRPEFRIEWDTVAGAPRPR